MAQYSTSSKFSSEYSLTSVSTDRTLPVPNVPEEPSVGHASARAVLPFHVGNAERKETFTKNSNTPGLKKSDTSKPDITEKNGDSCESTKSNTTNLNVDNSHNNSETDSKSINTESTTLGEETKFSRPISTPMHIKSARISPFPRHEKIKLDREFGPCVEQELAFKQDPSQIPLGYILLAIIAAVLLAVLLLGLAVYFIFFNFPPDLVTQPPTSVTSVPVVVIPATAPTPANVTLPLPVPTTPGQYDIVIT